jgi:hypothetical protein
VRMQLPFPRRVGDQDLYLGDHATYETCVAASCPDAKPDQVGHLHLIDAPELVECPRLLTVADVARMAGLS